ncbi:tRNA (cytidine(56)-2'-O)-methyltransferase [Candidatus Bathyarchaeota archaeon]|nr:tRNA (cytidine(56)-2'-O)-methyltransferase [Candidatus Bathyarchaeota archaeon]
MPCEKEAFHQLAILVLRIGHRLVRDDRATTHLFLAARALGADTAVYSGQKDMGVENSLDKVKKAWGGSFKLEYTHNWKRFLEDHRSQGWKIIHLTMYGLPIESTIEDIRSNPADKIVVVGGPKVPSDVYEIADWNLSVTSQPHSEISALSVFLHEFFKGNELSKEFYNGELRITPQAKGKKVTRQTSTQDSGQ